MKLVEQIGSGIRRIHDACQEHGVADPSFRISADWLTITFPRRESTLTHHVALHDAPHVTPQVERLIAILQGVMGRAELMEALYSKDRPTFTGLTYSPALRLAWSR